MTKNIVLIIFIINIIIIIIIIIYYDLKYSFDYIMRMIVMNFCLFRSLVDMKSKQSKKQKSWRSSSTGLTVSNQFASDSASAIEGNRSPVVCFLSNAVNFL